MYRQIGVTLEAMLGTASARRLTIRKRILLFQVVDRARRVLAFRGRPRRRSATSISTSSAAHSHTSNSTCLTGLQRAANQYSEKLASFLAAGFSEPTEIARLHSDLASGFGALESATRRERDFLLRHGAATGEDAELTRASRMRELYDDLNRSFEALVAMRGAGQSEAAMQVYFRNVEGGLNDALEASDGRGDRR